MIECEYIAAFTYMRLRFLSFADSFVNSQEWTISRSVPDIRLGIVGSLSSGKSALVHRYLTGTYMQEESPEGGRFKKEIQIDNQSYLLLIRDEGGPPEIQVSDTPGLVDAIMPCKHVGYWVGLTVVIKYICPPDWVDPSIMMEQATRDDSLRLWGLAATKDSLGDT